MRRLHFTHFTVLLSIPRFCIRLIIFLLFFFVSDSLIIFTSSLTCTIANNDRWPVPLAQSEFRASLQKQEGQEVRHFDFVIAWLIDNTSHYIATNTSLVFVGLLFFIILFHNVFNHPLFFVVVIVIPVMFEFELNARFHVTSTSPWLTRAIDPHTGVLHLAWKLHRIKVTVPGKQSS